MLLYPSMLPLFVAAALGAIVGRAAWRRAGLPGHRGALVAGPAAALGPLLTMVPLRSCTFEPGRGGLDLAVGVVAFAAGAAVAVAAAVRLGRALSLPGGLARLDSGRDAHPVGDAELPDRPDPGPGGGDPRQRLEDARVQRIRCSSCGGCWSRCPGT